MSQSQTVFGSKPDTQPLTSSALIINKELKQQAIQKKSSKQLALEKAIQENDADTARKLLLEGVNPANPNASIMLRKVSHGMHNIPFESNEEYKGSLIELLIKSAVTTLKNYEAADRLLQLGASLPAARDSKVDSTNVLNRYLHVVHGDFNQDKFKFSDLLSYDEEMYIALRKNPTIVNEKNSDGQTLLHTITDHLLSRNMSNLSWDLLFSHPKVTKESFTVSDNEGFDPLQYMMMHCSNRHILEMVPEFLKKAGQHGYNFNVPSKEGKTLIHYAAILQDQVYHFPPLPQKSLIKILIDTAGKTLDINAISKTGATAFYYAVNHGQFREANLLLDAGANPLLYGDPDRNPMKFLLEAEKELNNKLKELQEKKEGYELGLKEIKNLLQRINAYMHGVKCHLSSANLNYCI